MTRTEFRRRFMWDQYGIQPLFGCILFLLCIGANVILVEAAAGLL